MTDNPPHLADPDHNPSFIKSLFLGEIREDLVFPFPELSSDERESLKMILDSVHAFAAERVSCYRVAVRSHLTVARAFYLATGFQPEQELSVLGAPMTYLTKVVGE